MDITWKKKLAVTAEKCHKVIQIQVSLILWDTLYIPWQPCKHFVYSSGDCEDSPWICLKVISAQVEPAFEIKTKSSSWMARTEFCMQVLCFRGRASNYRGIVARTTGRRQVEVSLSALLPIFATIALKQSTHGQNPVWETCWGNHSPPSGLSFLGANSQWGTSKLTIIRGNKGEFSYCFSRHYKEQQPETYNFFSQKSRIIFPFKALHSNH